MFAKISFKLAQKVFPSRAILGALCRIRVNSIEVVSADEQVAGETASVLKGIPRRLGELKRFALAFGHFRSVDDGSRHRSFRFCTGFLSDLFFRCFERGFHGGTGIPPAGTQGILPGVRTSWKREIDRLDARLLHRHAACATSFCIKFRPVTRMPLQYLARRKFLLGLSQPL